MGIIAVYIGIMEKKMETTVTMRGLYRDNGKENGNYGIIGRDSRLAFPCKYESLIGFPNFDDECAEFQQSLSWGDYRVGNRFVKSPLFCVRQNWTNAPCTPSNKTEPPEVILHHNVMRRRLTCYVGEGTGLRKRRPWCVSTYDWGQNCM